MLVVFSLGLSSTPQIILPDVSLCFLFTLHAPESIGISLFLWKKQMMLSILFCGPACG